MALQPGKSIIYPILEGIPEELRQIPCWQVWKAEGTQKVPYISKTKRFSGEYRKKREQNGQPVWLTFYEAWALYIAGGFSGVEIHLDGAAQAGKPLVVLDLDNCQNPETGELNNLANGIVQAYRDSWIEASPSGTGLHIFFFNPSGCSVEDLFSSKEYQGETAPGMKAPVKIECFSKGRPICITGAHTNSLPIATILESDLKEFGRMYLAPKNAPTSSPQPGGSVRYDAIREETHTPEEIIAAFSRSKRMQPEYKYLFKSLDVDRLQWEKPNSNIKTDVSSLTMLLCNALTYYTINHDEIKNVFERSALFNSLNPAHLKKWNGGAGLKQISNACSTRDPEHMYNWGHKKEGAQLPPAPAGAADPAQYDEHMLPLDIKEKAAFPLHVLPMGLQDFIKDVSEEFKIDHDYAGMGVITMASIALAGKYKVKVRQGYVTGLPVFTLIVGNPGTDKSNVYTRLMPPLDKYKKDICEEYAPLIEERKSDRSLLTIKIKETEKALKQAINASLTGKKKKNSNAKSVEELEKELTELNYKLAEIPEIFFPWVTIKGDTTIEAFKDALKKMNGHLSICSDEGSDFIRSVLGRYDGITNVEPFIQLYQGGIVEDLRIGRGLTRIRRATGSILLYTQPNVKVKVTSNEDAAGQGFIDRFAIIEPPQQITYVFDPEFTPDEQAQAFYDGTMAKLFSMPYPDDADPEEKTITLSHDAFMMWGKFNEWAKNQARIEGSKYHYIGGYMAKLADKAVRFAGILHTLAHQADPSASPIDGDTMQRGIELAKYCLSHFAYHNGATTGDTSGLAVKLIEYIFDLREKERQKGKPFTTFVLRNLLRKTGGCEELKTKLQAVPVLEYLEDCNVLSLVNDKPKRINASNEYIVNQKLFTAEGLKELGIYDLMSKKAGK